MGDIYPIIMVGTLALFCVVVVVADPWLGSPGTTWNWAVRSARKDEQGRWEVEFETQRQRQRSRFDIRVRKLPAHPVEIEVLRWVRCAPSLWRDAETGRDARAHRRGDWLVASLEEFVFMRERADVARG